MGRPPSWIQSSGIVILRRPVQTSECSGVDGVQFAPSCQLVDEAGISDHSSYAPRRSGSVPGRVPSRDREFLHEVESYYKGAINVDKDFNRRNLIIVPRLEPECERRYRMPRSLYESVRARCWRWTRTSSNDLLRPSAWARLWYVPSRLQLGRRASPRRPTRSPPPSQLAAAAEARGGGGRQLKRQRAGGKKR
jgi:hypothetical protein